MLERVNEVRARGGSYQELLDARGDLFKMVGAGFRLYYGGYQVKDGAVILGALTPANRDQMRRVIGVEDDPTGNPEFDAMAPESEAIAEAVGERIRAIMLTKTMDEWTAAFDAEGAPAASVNLPEEMADQEAVRALGVMIDLEHPLTGPEQMVGSIVTMSATPTGAALPSPPLDAHTDELLSAHGFTTEEIAALRTSGAAGAPRG